MDFIYSRWPDADPATDLLRAQFVASLVALATGVPPREIVASARAGAPAARARQMAMYLAHTAFAWPLSRVGLAFGRDRTTASHACHLIEDLRDDRVFDGVLSELERCLRAAPEPMRSRRGALPTARAA